MEQSLETYMEYEVSGEYWSDVHFSGRLLFICPNILNGNPKKVLLDLKSDKNLRSEF